PRHTLPNQKKVRMRNRLVIKLSFTTGRGKPLELCGKFRQRLQRRILTKISKRQPHMVRMMEAVAGKGVSLKTPYQFFILHDLKPRNSKLETRNSSLTSPRQSRTPPPHRSQECPRRTTRA